jgi:hypothetical protein
MSELWERMIALAAEVEAKGEGKTIAEQELLVIEFGEQIQRMMMQEMVAKAEGKDKKKLAQVVRNP